MAGNIVVEWLRSLHLGQYAESFLDNGYDDLEICKQVGDPDLDAIGVFNPAHRGRLLASVRTLREEGAASVYFTLEETAAAAAAVSGKDLSDDCSCGGGGDAASRASDKSSSAGGGGGGGSGAAGASPGAASSSAGSASGSGSAELCGGGGGAVGRYADEYEEGKAELVRFPRMQLKLLLRERVAQDGVRLSAQPYSTAVSRARAGRARSGR
ncbi:hypothetical protein R5R35_011516 [Gryllus longicercus]|uniref:Sterile alpha motif domain-containing protein 5 n=1 Tax=Gryllus longicercus TaxID=2509291 RepID=A0AAN9V7B2_9ORTH